MRDANTVGTLRRVWMAGENIVIQARKPMSKSSAPKHVIILGAGASVTSGYPDAKKLRLLLMSENKVREELTRRGENLNDREFNNFLSPMFAQDGNMTRLFREGGFATVDEFSSLAQSRFAEEIKLLKWRLRWALALHNPEKEFENSDYYAFIQKLFHRQIFPLRKDVAILTFNYDPYLAFLLKRAAKVRYEVDGKSDIGVAEHCLTSGFEGRNLDALAHGDDLCLLHLHGIIAWPDRADHQSSVTFDDLFTDYTIERFRKLHARREPVPIVFPWEVFGKNGGLCKKQDFCLREASDENGYLLGGYSGTQDLHDLFVAIWTRAQREITRATKISFVGISMHEFLTPAFKFLFSKKKSSADICIANKDLETFNARDQALNAPRSTAYKIDHMLRKVWPGIEQSLSNGRRSLSLHETFDEFIKYEMD